VLCYSEPESFYSNSGGLNKLPQLSIQLPQNKITGFCQRWSINEFAVFGSILRDDFTSESDIDVLVTFAPDAQWSLLDHVEMQEELQTILDRPVDLLTRPSVERSRNYLRRKAILNSAEVIYARS
jgi:predicted nucleotidyltransferase